MGAPLRKLSGDPDCKNGTCPTLWGTDDGNYVVQGYVITDPERWRSSTYQRARQPS